MLCHDDNDSSTTLCFLYCRSTYPVYKVNILVVIIINLFYHLILGLFNSIDQEHQYF